MAICCPRCHQEQRVDNASASCPRCGSAMATATRAGAVPLPEHCEVPRPPAETEQAPKRNVALSCGLTMAVGGIIVARSAAGSSGLVPGLAPLTVVGILITVAGAILFLLGVYKVFVKHN